MTDDNEPKKEPKFNKVFGTLALEDHVQSPIVKLFRVFSKFVDAPVVWFRENVVEKNRAPPYPYYHRKFNRVPTIDQCYNDDLACLYEAQEQFMRDRKVDFEIMKILRNRYSRCSFYERAVNEWEGYENVCMKERKDMWDAQLNLFIKYGELGPYVTVIQVFMKQKHRLIWERRQREKKERQRANL